MTRIYRGNRGGRGSAGHGLLQLRPETGGVRKQLRLHLGNDKNNNYYYKNNNDNNNDNNRI